MIFLFVLYSSFSGFFTKEKTLLIDYKTSASRSSCVPVGNIISSDPSSHSPLLYSDYCQTLEPVSFEQILLEPSFVNTSTNVFELEEVSYTYESLRIKNRENQILPILDSRQIFPHSMAPLKYLANDNKFYKVNQFTIREYDFTEGVIYKYSPNAYSELEDLRTLVDKHRYKGAAPLFISSKYVVALLDHKLQLFERNSLKLSWQKNFGSFYFWSDPNIINDKLYLFVLNHKQEMSILIVNLADGNLIKGINLGVSSFLIRPENYQIVSDDQLIISSNYGLMLSIGLASDKLNWIKSLDLPKTDLFKYFSGGKVFAPQAPVINFLEDKSLFAIYNFDRTIQISNSSNANVVKNHKLGRNEYFLSMHKNSVFTLVKKRNGQQLIEKNLVTGDTNKVLLTGNKLYGSVKKDNVLAFKLDHFLYKLDLSLGKIIKQNVSEKRYALLMDIAVNSFVTKLGSTVFYHGLNLQPKLKTVVMTAPRNNFSAKATPMPVKMKLYEPELINVPNFNNILMLIGNDLICMDSKGNILWSRPVFRDLNFFTGKGVISSFYGSSQITAFYKDNILVVNDGLNLVALNPSDGSAYWHNTNYESFNRMIIRYEDNALWLAKDNTINKIDIKTGNIIKSEGYLYGNIIKITPDLKLGFDNSFALFPTDEDLNLGQESYLPVVKMDAVLYTATRNLYEYLDKPTNQIDNINLSLITKDSKINLQSSVGEITKDIPLEIAGSYLDMSNVIRVNNKLYFTISLKLEMIQTNAQSEIDTYFFIYDLDLMTVSKMELLSKVNYRSFVKHTLVKTDDSILVNDRYYLYNYELKP